MTLAKPYSEVLVSVSPVATDAVVALTGSRRDQGWWFANPPPAFVPQAYSPHSLRS